jgi:acyl-CoA synthetase (AMP-forming)/AMP-acid ligase II
MLLTKFGSRHAAHPLWVTPTIKIDSAEATRRALELRARWHSLVGRRFAVWLRDPSHFLTAILALDGFAERLLLIPAELSQLQLVDFCTRADIDALVVDGAEPIASELDVMVLRWPEGSGAELPQISSGEMQKTTWVLTTSGTTGTPKLVPHALSALTATAQADVVRGREIVWGLLYDPARFAGLQVVLQSLLGGSTLVVPGSHLALSDAMKFMVSEGVNALSATPTLWRKMLMVGKCSGLQLRTVTLGGEIADERTLRALSTAFPKARLRHVYASTEAGVGFSVTDGVEGFPARWLESPPPGVELRIVPDDESGNEGELQLRSRRSAWGYHGGGRLVDSTGWLATGDRVRISDSRVRFLGRINGSINVGGDKVYPEQVEELLCMHASVGAAVVRGRKSPLVGSLVEALVVPAPGIEPSAALRDELLLLCRASLSRPAVPAFLRFVTKLNVNASGKKDRSQS